MIVPKPHFPTQSLENTAKENCGGTALGVASPARLWRDGPVVSIIATGIGRGKEKRRHVSTHIEAEIANSPKIERFRSVPFEGERLASNFRFRIHL